MASAPFNFFNSFNETVQMYLRREIYMSPAKFSPSDRPQNHSIEFDVWEFFKLSGPNIGLPLSPYNLKAINTCSAFQFCFANSSKFFSLKTFNSISRDCIGESDTQTV